MMWFLLDPAPQGIAALSKQEQNPTKLAKKSQHSHGPTPKVVLRGSSFPSTRKHDAFFGKAAQIDRPLLPPSENEDFSFSEASY